MNEEFSVDPGAFDNAMELKYLLEKFGFFQGRFIVKSPSKWVGKVYDQLIKLPDIEQARARSILAKNKDALVPFGCELDSRLSWLENIHQQVQNNKISGVITNEKNEWGYPNLDEVDNDYLLGGHGQRVLNKAENYTKITRRLLELSHEIVLVDPYLALDKSKNEKVLASFLEVAQREKSKYFVVWAREGSGMKTKEAYQEMLETKYKPRLSKKSRLTVKLVKDKHSVNEMHARLMLSSLGGFSFDKGFAEDINEKYVDISILDKKNYEDHYNWYLAPGSSNDFEIQEYVIEG